MATGATRALAPNGLCRPRAAHLAAFRHPRQQRRAPCAVAGATGEAAKSDLALPRKGHMMISKTEVPSFIQRDDMMDQLYRWAVIEAGEGGLRNFGMPMNVAPVFHQEVMWGFDLEIIREGVKKADLGVNFDGETALKHEWVGRDQDGFPTFEGDAMPVLGKHIEIWCATPLPCRAQRGVGRATLRLGRPRRRNRGRRRRQRLTGCRTAAAPRQRRRLGGLPPPLRTLWAPSAPASRASPLLPPSPSGSSTRRRWMRTRAPPSARSATASSPR